MEMTIVVPNVVNVGKIDPLNGSCQLILRADPLDKETHGAINQMAHRYIEDEDYAMYIAHSLSVKLMRANLLSSIHIDNES